MAVVSCLERDVKFKSLILILSAFFVDNHSARDISRSRDNYIISMEQHSLINVNNGFNTKIYSNLKTSGGQSSILYLNVHFLNTSVNKTSVAA
jgi:hypothetical protein